MPPDWTIDATNASLQTLEAPKDATGFPPGRGGIGVGSLAGGDQAEQFDWVAKHAKENDYAGYDNFKRLPDEVINGTKFFRFQFDSEAVWWDVYGTVTADGEHSILIEWQFDKTIDRKQAEDIWSPVMPTFKMP
ncbi:hypothetical protein J2S40_004185 [Nocardioides luteus]|uniref:SnoaL-like domain-containing protein n=1 Tax=Nocardioides luteus TaxID=1844 RepID=A0ABQ5SPW3_9ACTN|nr:hypothetical protein [Nocardioides luteus]MDR7313127.1 hypothetical protein [Nocardioides luteus]GGR43916.1 hypothetical protein GCM10010197_06710 [Nocardioides luteus]GLJ66190.1 hypothetical protein GCM10017579_02260 [Nocardioides luteus]